MHELKWLRIDGDGDVYVDDDEREDDDGDAKADDDDNADECGYGGGRM